LGGRQLRSASLPQIPASETAESAGWAGSFKKRNFRWGGGFGESSTPLTSPGGSHGTAGKISGKTTELNMTFRSHAEQMGGRNSVRGIPGSAWAARGCCRAKSRGTEIVAEKKSRRSMGQSRARLSAGMLMLIHNSNNEGLVSLVIIVFGDVALVSQKQMHRRPVDSAAPRRAENYRSRGLDVPRRRSGDRFKPAHEQTAGRIGMTPISRSPPPATSESTVGECLEHCGSWRGTPPHRCALHRRLARLKIFPPVRCASNAEKVSIRRSGSNRPQDIRQGTHGFP